MPPPTAGLAPSVSPCQFLSLTAVILQHPDTQRNWAEERPQLDLGSFHLKIRKRESSRRGVSLPFRLLRIPQGLGTVTGSICPVSGVHITYL